MCNWTCGDAMQLEIKHWHSPDVDLWSWEPESSKDVHFLLQLKIGAQGDSRADTFALVVATPEGLRGRAGSGEVLSERALLVVSSYSAALLRQAVAAILAKCEDETFTLATAKLQRYFAWEYEDYKEGD
jgi:hypothetical protein